MSFIDDLKTNAEKAMNNPTVKNAIDKSKEFIQSEKGKETLKKAKDKVEDFIEDKTDGKGIFGFGKKD